MNLEELDNLSTSIKQLHTAYEKYFAGIDRVEPAKDREKVKKTLNRLITQQDTNTARRFKLQSLQATFITHESYWNRLTKQIEEGTFKRDRLKAQQLLAPQTKAEGAIAQEETTAKTAKEAALLPPASAGKGAAPLPPLNPAAPATAKPNAAPLPPPARSPTSPGAPPPPSAAAVAKAPSPAQPDPLRKLYADYVNARTELGHKDPVAIETLAAVVEKQKAAVKAQFKCNDVEFKVAVKDGKAILKAIPKM